jgi:hypothetical protein
LAKQKKETDDEWSLNYGAPTADVEILSICFHKSFILAICSYNNRYRNSYRELHNVRGNAVERHKITAAYAA